MSSLLRAYWTDVCILDSCLSLQQRCTLKSWHLLKRPHTINKLPSVYNQLIHAHTLIPATLNYGGKHMHRTYNRTLLLVCIHCTSLSFANEDEEDHHMRTKMFDDNNLCLQQQRRCRHSGWSGLGRTTFQQVVGLVPRLH